MLYSLPTKILQCGAGVENADALLKEKILQIGLGESDLCVLRLQDCLELGADARMNFPGTTDHNWTWRALPGSYDQTLAERLRKLTALYGRLETQ